MLSTRKTSEIVKLYGKRFTIEKTFRDEKNLHFEINLYATHVRDASRRYPRPLAAIAHSLLTLLNAASEEANLYWYLKVNTVRVTHSALPPRALLVLLHPHHARD